MSRSWRCSCRPAYTAPVDDREGPVPGLRADPEAPRRVMSPVVGEYFVDHLLGAGRERRVPPLEVRDSDERHRQRPAPSPVPGGVVDRQGGAEDLPGPGG